MAENLLNPGVQRTNDPSYLNSSQGTDRASLQPLASTPELSTKYVSPDWATDKTAGTAIKGLGDIGDAALKLTDQVIQQKADDTLRKGIDNIRDSFGVAQAADMSSGIAKAVGAGGAEGVSLLDDTKTNQPLAINRLGNKIAGLTESYQQGGLSDSAYYAKMEAFVRETKTQFPGYSEIIDQKVSGILGTTPANALRSAIKNDVAELQRKVQAGADKWTTYEHSNSQYIHTIWPNYEQLKADGKAPSRLDVEANVGKLQARDYAMDSKTKDLALGKSGDQAVSDKAYDIAIQKASEISRTTTIGLTNTMGINTSADMQKYIQDVNAGLRPAPTPDEKTQLTGMFAILKQKASAAFDDFATKPLAANSTETLASKLRDPQKYAQAKQLALTDLSTIEDGLLNDKHGLVAATVNWNKASDATADQNLTTKMPNAAVVGAIHRKMGDQALAGLFVDQGPTLMAGLRRAGWQDLDGSVPVQTTIGNLSKDDPSGAASRQHVTDAAKMVIHKDTLEDKTLADRAFTSLFGPGNTTLVDSFKGKAQVQVFTDMVSPQMTKAVSKRGKEDQATYTKWAEDGFASVFQTQAMGANAAAESYFRGGNFAKFAIKYDPESETFRYEAPATMPKIAVQSANGTLAPLNTAISSLKAVNKLSGKNTLDNLYHLLPTVGIEGGSPIYNAIQREYLIAHRSDSVNP